MLVVDTVGFVPGTLIGQTPHSAQLHVVERFSVDPATTTLKREVTAEDPLFFTASYTRNDTMIVSTVPYAAEACQDLTPARAAGGSALSAHPCEPRARDGCWRRSAPPRPRSRRVVCSRITAPLAYDMQAQQTVAGHDHRVRLGQSARLSVGARDRQRPSLGRRGVLLRRR